MAGTCRDLRDCDQDAVRGRGQAPTPSPPSPAELGGVASWDIGSPAEGGGFPHTL